MMTVLVEVMEEAQAVVAREATGNQPPVIRFTVPS
jgi:hypothetical protein